MKYTDALKLAVEYIAEDAAATVWDVVAWLDHTANVAILVALTFGNFLCMPITAPLWALEIQRDPDAAEAEQHEKNDL
jgi:hypothetical protein